MKIVRTEYLIKAGSFPQSKEWKTIDKDIQEAIKAIVWPPKKLLFTIFPESGKKRGKGNGVKAIKDAFCLKLKQQGWNLETRLTIAKRKNPGPIDATKKLRKQSVLCRRMGNREHIFNASSYEQNGTWD